LAQELKKIAPYMVTAVDMDGGEYLQVDNSAMTYLLINAVKELHSENRELKTRNTQLLSEILGMQADIMEIINRLEKDGSN